MLHHKKINALLLIISVLFIFLYSSCSNKKNTTVTRAYHSINTRYNIHFNAEEAYKEALKAKNNSRNDNLSQILNIFPDNSDTTKQEGSGSFTTTIDKTTTAIKLHSIKTKPSRNPNRRNDVRYQAWLQQKEFNPFLQNTWLLLAKAEFQDGDYLRSITTFLYITKIYSTNPEIVGECRLWIARAYTEMGWMYEAANVLHKMELAGGPPEKHRGLYAAVKANYLVRNNEFEEAIPHLIYAIDKERDRTQKMRMRYLLGQIYTKLGDKTNANLAFLSVKGLSTPYRYVFNAELRQMELSELSTKETVARLDKMARSSKNEDYLDQIYFTIGNTYLQQQDTTKAIENYRKAIEKSKRNGYDKAIAQVTLGDLYYNQREFISAQPFYADALSQLKKTHSDYARVALRSSVLDELVVHAKVLHEQDSLQHLAQLPETERLDIINKKIEGLKKAEAEKIKAEELEKLQEERNERISSWDDLERESLFQNNNPTPPAQQQQQAANFGQQGDVTSFYFYNPQTVEQGKITFQNQWGNRKLEDDWRRRNKAASSFADMDEPDEDAPVDDQPKIAEDNNSIETKATNQDIYSVDYYLQQLPFTEKAIKESNDLIENALFNMGKIYKYKLGDLDLAIDAFTTDIRRFPNTPNLEEIYYQLFLIYMQQGNHDMMASYRSRLLTEFPQGVYARPLSDPDYEWNFRHMASLQDSLYEATYQAYLSTDTKTVRDNYNTIQDKYPFGDLMPKFAFLNALSYAQTRDAVNLGNNLKELIDKYPKADVTPLATEILSRIKDGQILLSNGSPIRSLDWSRAFLSDSTMVGEDGKTIEYSDSLNTQYLLLLRFKANSIDRNELLYQVADYNFSNYVIQTFDLNFETDKVTETLQIRGFEKFSNIRSYINRAFEEDGLFHHMDTSIVAIPISVENYTTMLPRLGLDAYITFFAEHFGEQLPNLINYWKTHEIQMIETEDDEFEYPADKPLVEPIEEKLSSGDIKVVPDNNKEKPVDNKQPQKKDEEKNKTDINADDLLTKDQLEAAGKINDALESVEDIVNNPVDGIKNLFGKFKNKEKLTKEEKAALKEEQRIEKALQKELKAIEKAKQDSINSAEKAIQDSIQNAEKLKLQQQRAAELEKENTAKAIAKEKQDAIKQREAERKEKIRLQEERRRELEKERKEKEKAREQLRKQKEKEANERRKQQEKNRK